MLQPEINGRRLDRQVLNRIMLSVGLLCAISAAGQDKPAVFQTTTELVLVDVQVLHSKTRTSTASLRPADLHLYEDGVRQEIRHFARDEAPLSVLLLFDLTDSVRGVLTKLAEGAVSALGHFKPEDVASVMVYAARVELVDGFTTDRERTVRAIGRAATMKSGEPAHFNEAIYRAAQQLGESSNPLSRRVVIWLTDNLPNVPFRKSDSPPHTENEALRALNEEGVTVVPILMKNRMFLPMVELMMVFEAPWRKAYPPGDAHKYAEATGGIAMGLRGKRVDERLAAVIDDLRSRYTIGYRPSESKLAGTFCKLRVELAPDGALRPREWMVVARQGYYRK